MDAVQFTDEELTVLHDVVKSSLLELGNEISHTDTRDFKAALRKRQETLQAVFDKLEASVSQLV